MGNTSITANWKAVQASYKVEHYKQNLDYTFTLAETENKSAVTGTTVTATSKTYDGFDYASSYNGTITSGVVKGDGSLVLKLYYTRKQVSLTIDPMVVRMMVIHQLLQKVESTVQHLKLMEK